MSNQSLHLLGHSFLQVLSAASMRDLESPHLVGMMMVNALRGNGLNVVDEDSTQELPTINLPLAVRAHQALGCDTLELEQVR